MRLRDDTAHAYPHELSGGQQQRVALAPRLVLKPNSFFSTSRSRISISKRGSAFRRGARLAVRGPRHGAAGDA